MRINAEDIEKILNMTDEEFYSIVEDHQKHIDQLNKDLEEFRIKLVMYTVCNENLRRAGVDDAFVKPLEEIVVKYRKLIEDSTEKAAKAQAWLNGAVEAWKAARAIEAGF